MSDSNPDIVGAVVAGKYRIKRRIGAGGMGAVYEGEHVEIGKRVAIKVIEHSSAQSAELASRFKREARAASAVESEHIVHVFDVGTDEKVGLYMVMEFLSGEDIASRIEKAGGKLPIDEAINLSIQAARGLAKAHAAGVVHRDLKPANLFVTMREDGTPCVKILDFGISKLVRTDDGNKAGSSALTREGTVMGTPMYMSPQQAQGMALDHRTDIWSLGAVIFEALTGSPPWDPRDTYEQMIIQIVTQKPKSVTALAPHVPEAIARVVESALQHDLESRTQDASTLAKQLAEAAKLPSSPTSARSIDATVVASSPAGSGPPVSVKSNPQTGGASNAQPTGVGVVVARTQADADPKKRSMIPLAIAGLALAALTLTGVVLATRPDANKNTSTGSGIVATSTTPSAQTSASSAPSATSTTTLLPLATESASAATSASAPPSSASATPPTKQTGTAVSTKPIAKPTNTAAGATTATGAARPGQYGAAGVSTAY